MKTKDIVCTTALTKKEFLPPDEYVEFVKMIYGSRTHSMTQVTVKDKSGKNKVVESIITI